ncbi:MAG: branched-chain amino acid ABC transporter permease [Alphaproteobacteria bacterium]|nr:branched-chain amino acid ABC transporter permease [Alphaproteobacteria bacterium]
MIYREAGQIKTTYRADMAIFPIAQDRIGFMIIMAVAIVAIPTLASTYVLEAFMIPFLIWGLAAMSLNIMLGYAGQLSLGHGGFMAVGAYAAYNFATRIPDLNLIVCFLLAGLVTAAVGVFFGLPSLRIKGFYLAVATLAAQFIIEFVISSFPWFAGDNMMGAVDTPAIVLFGWQVDETVERYYFVLGFVVVLTLLCKNMVRSSIGRSWMAIRDMDVAAEVIGIRPLQTKLIAFGVSSFLAGIAGALYAFVYLKACDITSFDLFQSFNILFMVILGGLGSLMGSYLGAAFVMMLPIVLNLLTTTFLGGTGHSDFIANAEHMVYGGLIMFFLIVEPYGLARMWTTTKEKLRLWPFPH